MKKLQILLLGFLLIFSLGYSQTAPEKPIVIKANYFDISPPLRDMILQNTTKADLTWRENVVKNSLNVFNPNPDNTDSYFADPIRQSAFGTTTSDTTIQNFEGVGFSGSLPPDTDGDVSSDFYMQIVNLRYKVFNKSGVGVFGPFNNSSVFTGLPNNSNDGDGIVLWDENAGRWLFSQFSLPNYPNAPFYQNVAISQTSDPTGAWYRYQFTFSVMPDYPKFSVWGDAYYMTIRRFSSGSGSWLGPAAVALDRNKMLVGDPSAAMVMFNLPSSSEGPLSLDCDSDFPPAGTPNYVSYLVSSPPQLNMYAFHVDWTNTANCTFNLDTSVPITAFSTLGSNVIPQKGTTQKVDAFSRKGLMFRMPFRKFNGYWSAVASFTVNVSGKAGVRWMEIRNSGSGWSLYQEGTYAPDAVNYRWMPSIAMDSSGNIALGYSISSSNMYPSIRYTGRLAGDALGSMTLAEKGIMNGGGSQTDNSGRWGDYSCMSVDPSAPGTFWYTNEYYSSTSSAAWQTRIGSFSIGNLFGSYATASPVLICQGQDSIQLTSVAYGGTGTYTYSWTSVPPGFTSTLRTPKAAPGVNTRYVCSVSDGTKTRSDSTSLVTVMGAVYTNAGPDTIVDPSVNTIQLHGIADNARAIQWQTTGNGTFGNATQLNTTYTFGSVDKTNGGVQLKLIGVATPPCTGNYTSIRGIFLWPLGIQNNTVSKLSISIQPNPARKDVSIIISGMDNSSGSLTILNMNGSTVYSENLEASSSQVTKQIDLTNFARGIYIVRLKTDRSVETKQLVVQ